jgi:hypothetical protein
VDSMMAVVPCSRAMGITTCLPIQPRSASSGLWSEISQAAHEYLARRATGLDRCCAQVFF